MPNKWQLRSKESFSKSFLGLCLGDSLVARLLVNRGVHNEELLQYYVSTENVKFSSPFEIPEMDKAFHRVKTAIAKNEKILIYNLDFKFNNEKQFHLDIERQNVYTPF